MAVLARYNLGTFLFRPLENNNVKWSNSALSEEREPRKLFFKNFYFKSIAVPQIQFRESFDSISTK